MNRLEKNAFLALQCSFFSLVCLAIVLLYLLFGYPFLEDGTRGTSFDELKEHLLSLDRERNRFIEHRKIERISFKGREYDIKSNWAYSFVHGSVKRVPWRSGVERFASQVAKEGLPVVLEGFSDWDALALWNPEYFSQHFPILTNVQKHSNRTFYYFHSSKPMSSLMTSYREHQTWEKLSEMSTAEFFEKIQQVPPYHYWTGKLSDIGSVLIGEVFPIEPLMVEQPDRMTSDDSHRFRWTNVWIGGANASTQAHFDVYHNFYVQVYGKKQFILFPPSQHRNLYINPFLHPGALQSQVNFEHPNLTEFPNFEQVSGIQTTLFPGDVLYIPPMWFHHVLSLLSSVSPVYHIL